MNDDNLNNANHHDNGDTGDNGNGADPRKREKLQRDRMLDSEFLTWLLERLVERYDESPNVDFVHRLRDVITNVEALERQDSADALTLAADVMMEQFAEDKYVMSLLPGLYEKARETRHKENEKARQEKAREIFVEKAARHIYREHEKSIRGDNRYQLWEYRTPGSQRVFLNIARSLLDAGILVLPPEAINPDSE